MLFLLLLGFFILELYVFIAVGASLGAGFVLLLIFLTAFGGVAVLKSQGQGMLGKPGWSSMRGEVPTIEVLEKPLVLLGGLLLFLPGFVSDALGLLCLLRPTRFLIIRYLSRFLFGSFLERFILRGWHRSKYAPFANSPFSSKPSPKPDQTDLDWNRKKSQKTKHTRTIEGEYTFYEDDPKSGSK